MPQPRKEQIKDLRTKFVRFATGSPVIGGGASPTQVLTGANYTNFLAATRTGVVGGVETDAPAIAQGGTGPFNLTTLNSFSIRIPGYNSNVPMNVTIQSSDIVTLGGVPVVTTSHLVNRINTVVAGYGITNPIASNVNGQIVLTTGNIPLLGSAATITLADLVFGTLALIGFGATVYAGLTSPTRGIITQSSDGLGGYVQLKNLDQTVSEPVNTQMVHMGNRQYSPIVMPGQPAFARITAAPSSIRFDFYRNGPINPSVVSKLSNFSTINPGDTVLIILNFSATFSTAFDVVFGIVTTVQNVIDQINAAYTANTLIAFGVESTRASVIAGIPGPWSFRNTNINQRDAFYLKFNTNPIQVHVVPTTDGTPVSASDFATLINNAINAAQGSLGDGHAVASGDNVIIESQILGSSSSVNFIPDPIVVYPNSMLDMLGISPGFYASSLIAVAYGSDEIQITCPSALPGSNISVNGDPGIVTTKLGIVANTVIPVSNGPSKVPVPAAQILIPEVVEFSEEPDHYDTDLQNFDAVGSPASINPQIGVQNSGLAGGLLGPQGKIDPELLSSILNFLGSDRLSLGSRLIDSLSSQSQPRVVTPYDGIQGPVLIWEGTATTGNAQADVTRLYLFGDCVYLTINTFVNSYGGGGPSSIIWIIEGLANPFLYEYTGGKLSVATYPSSTPGVTFAHSAWVRNIKLNTTGTTDQFGFGAEILNLGSGLTGSIPNLLIPRIEVPEDPTSPNRILLIESLVPSSGTAYNLRVYIAAMNDLSISGLEITVNARWDGVNFNKDNAGLAAFRYGFFNGIQCQQKLAINNSPWFPNAWDTTLFQIDGSTSYAFIANVLNLGLDASTGFILDPTIPRIDTTRSNVTLHHRTLLFRSNTAGSNSFPIRVYLENSDSGTGNGFIYCANCYYNDSTNHWVQDSASLASSAISYNSGTFFSTAIYLFLKNPGSVPWTETNWDKSVNLSANQIIAEGAPVTSSRINFTDGTGSEVDVTGATFDTIALSQFDVIKTNLGPYLVTNADTNLAYVMVLFGDNLGSGGFVHESVIEIAANSTIPITIPSRYVISTPGQLRVKLRVQSGASNTITVKGLDGNFVLGTYEIIRP